MLAAWLAGALKRNERRIFSHRIGGRELGCLLLRLSGALRSAHCAVVALPLATAISFCRPRTRACECFSAALLAVAVAVAAGRCLGARLVFELKVK